MRKWLVVVIFLQSLNCHAQTFQQWAQTVGWDGVSNWKRYIIVQPAFMGPNALPVPQIGSGSIDSNFFIGAAAQLHFSKGDNTQNAILYGNYCMVKDLISFDLNWVPYEHYTMSQAIKEERHVFSHFFYDRKAAGDILVNTNIQLLNKWRKYIHLVARAGYRFPTSSGLGTARFTDAPGYYFDLSFGKPLSAYFKFTGMLGFYSWQLQSDKHQQDDAFVFGGGIEWNKKQWRIQTNVAGYLGYIEGAGDKPVVARFSLEKKIKQFGLLFKFQQGLHDFKYSSFETGTKYFFKKK